MQFVDRIELFGQVARHDPVRPGSTPQPGITSTPFSLGNAGNSLSGPTQVDPMAWRGNCRAGCLQRQHGTWAATTASCCAMNACQVDLRRLIRVPLATSGAWRGPIPVAGSSASVTCVTAESRRVVGSRPHQPFADDENLHNPPLCWKKAGGNRLKTT